MGGRIFLFLFGLVFFSGGAFAGYSMGASLLDWQKMQSWESVSANVTNGGYKTTSSDDGETYKAYAEYTYRYDGRSYTGTRVAIDDMSDNIGNFHQDLGKRLENAAENGKPVTVFVNPDNPAESVVSRDMRWGMFGFKSIFLIAFGGIGLLVMVSAIRMPKPKDISGFDSTPWLVNNNWKTPEIKSEAQFAVRFMWGFALFWCLISAPLPFMLFEEVVEKKNYPALLGLLFPLIGVLLIAKAVHVTAEWKKFGEATVTLDPYPGSIGGQVGGFLELNWPFNAATKVILTLTNAYSYESGSGKNRRREEDIKWQDKIVAYTESGLYGTRILFRFDVPAGLEPSDALKVSSTYHLWRLNLTADMEGVGLDRSYEIPVYATAQKSARIDDRAVAQSLKETHIAAEAGAVTRVQLRQGAYGEEMFYPAGRGIGTAATLLIMGIVFIGACALLYIKEDAYIFGSIFGLVGIICAFCGLYTCTNSLTIVADGMGNILTLRRILGIPVKRRSVPTSDIRGLTKKTSFSTNDSSGKRVRYFTIYGELQGGGELQGRDKILLGEGFRDDREGDAALAMIRKKLGIKV